MFRADGYRALLVPGVDQCPERALDGALLDQLVIKRVLSRSQHLADTVDLQTTSDILVIYVDDFNISIDRPN